MEETNETDKTAAALKFDTVAPSPRHVWMWMVKQLRTIDKYRLSFYPTQSTWKRSNCLIGTFDSFEQQ